MNYLNNNLGVFLLVWHVKDLRKFLLSVIVNNIELFADFNLTAQSAGKGSRTMSHTTRILPATWTTQFISVTCPARKKR